MLDAVFFMVPRKRHSHIFPSRLSVCIRQTNRNEEETPKLRFHKFYFRLGFDCPRTYNPADFYLKVLSNTTQQEEGQYRKFFEKPIEILRRSSTYKPPNVADVERFNVKDYKM